MEIGPSRPSSCFVFHVEQGEHDYEHVWREYHQGMAVVSGKPSRNENGVFYASSAPRTSTLENVSDRRRIVGALALHAGAFHRVQHLGRDSMEPSGPRMATLRARQALLAVFKRSMGIAACYGDELLNPSHPGGIVKDEAAGPHLRAGACHCQQAHSRSTPRSDNTPDGMALGDDGDKSVPELLIPSLFRSKARPERVPE